MKSRTEILVPIAAIQAVPIAVIAWYRLHRYAWYRYSAIVIVENLNKFYKGKTVMIVAHRLSTVKNADQIVVIDHVMGYLEKYRIFVPELRRSLDIEKYRNEQKSARFHIVT